MRRAPLVLPLLLVLFGCTCRDAAIAPEKTPMSQPTQSCSDRIRALVLDGDLSGGHGLPAGCTRADAQQVLGAAGTPGSGALTGLTHAWLAYDRPGTEAKVRVWLDDDRVIMIDVRRPVVVQRPADLRRALGEPAERIQARIDPTHEEWIYPDRGLTIAVGKGLDDADDAPPHVSWFAAYPPTTLDDYVKRLGGKDAWVIRRPVRR